MTINRSRRAALLGGLSIAGSAALGAPLNSSLRPVPRPDLGPGVRPISRPSFYDLIARSELGGTVSFVAQDLDTGFVLADEDGSKELPPASVAKAVTALYALESLGPDYRFETDIYAKGVIREGVLDGDIVLAGGGDPQLSTDDLISLRSALFEHGITKVTGRFLVWGGAIDRVAEIEPSQLDHLGYNPSISGLNLNYNRVHFEWERQGSGYRVQMDARGRSEVPLVTMSRMEVVERGAPVFDYQDGNGTDHWTVARSALNSSGSRWLPVRYPSIYTGDVFRALSAKEGLLLPEPILANTRPEGEVLARYSSPTLSDVMRRMLDKSTNLTAEAAGLMASAARSDNKRGLRTSAFQMSAWMQSLAGGAPRFDDHSGLSDKTRITASEMARFLAVNGVNARLFPILKSIPFLDEKGRLLQIPPAEVRAKTGTLNFVTSLAGYLITKGGRRIAFAYFAADLDKREASKLTPSERPAGSASYNTRARLLQQSLLKHLVRIAEA